MHLVVIQPHVRRRHEAVIKGNRPSGDSRENCGEILLDLCHSVYSINNLLPFPFYGGNILRLREHFKRANFIAALWVAFFTFFIALLVSVGSQALITAINHVGVAVTLLFFIIALGVFFDIIGTAAAAATLPPFNAKAARKVAGASHAVRITKNASIVANYCNDVIGDIAGTLSGAIGAAIVFQVNKSFSVPDTVLTGAVMTSLIAALTVGGKAIGKTIAIENANTIIFRVALVMAWWEKLTGIGLFKGGR